jgi:hypothetical protein
MSLVHRCIIVPAAIQATCQTLCEMLAEGDAGKDMFLRGLCPTGEAESTHYISSGPIEEAFADILPLTTATTTYDEEGDATTTVSTRPADVAGIAALIAQAGMSMPTEQIAALLALIDVSEQPAEEAMARLGLVYTPEAEEAP